MDDKKLRRMKWEERVRFIWDVLYGLNQQSTIQEIADAAGLTRSPYLTAILHWLWAKGYIGKAATILENGRPAAVYWPIHDVTPPKA